MNKTCEKCMQLQIIQKVLKIKHSFWYGCFLMLWSRSMKVSVPKYYVLCTSTNFVFLILIVSHIIFKIENNFKNA